MTRKHSFVGWLAAVGVVLSAQFSSQAQDVNPPVIAELVPAADSIVKELTFVDVTFDENAQGVDAADLLVNEQPAATVKAISPREYIFEFPQPAAGTVNFRFVSDHGITDLAPLPNSFAGADWSCVLDTAVVVPELQLSEFMADNGHGIKDDDGNRSDWIELYNPTDTAADLGGWYLTISKDNPTQWQFPPVVVPAKGTLLVWASAKNRVDPALPLHTNFKLPKDGGYLALVGPDAKIVSGFAPAYPAQVEDVSYGRDPAEPNLVGFYPTPTPRAVNTPGGGGAGFAPDPVFSLRGGVFTNTPLRVQISAPAGVIHYTIDGSLPSATSPTYLGELGVEKATVVRARVFQDGVLPSAIVSQSYIFLDPTTRDFSSNLPLMIISTFGKGIASDVSAGGRRTRATMMAIEPFQGRASLRGELQYFGAIGIEVRGQSSTGFPKLPYNIELDDELGNDAPAPLLGFPAESDFALINPYSDKPFINNLLAQELFERMGHYAVRRRFVELFLDTNGQKTTYPGDYAGIYLLVEKIKVDDHRVDITKLGPEDTNAPAISGGYIFKKDKASPGDVIFNTSGGGGFGGQELRYHDPKPREITPAQKTWLRNYLNAMEKALYAPKWLTATGTNHWSYYIDADSFVDSHWIVEFTRQIDGYRLSNYFTKDRGGRVKMEPIWDWNLSFGNADYYDAQYTNGWYYSILGDQDHIWLRRLITGTTSASTTSGDPDFTQKITDRWAQLRTNILNSTNVLKRVDELASMLNEAQARDFKKWPRLGSYVWPNPPIYVNPTTYNGIIANMKTWIRGRYNWIDRQFKAVPAFNHPGGNIPPGFVLTMSGSSGTLYYTLDGSDPRLPGGAISPKAQAYSGPVTIQDNTRAFARTLTGKAWSGPRVASFVVRIPEIVISEIMYHPAPPPLLSPYQRSDFEFVELLNRGSTAVNLAGYHLSGGLEFVFPDTSLAPGERVVVVRNPAAFASLYGNGPRVAGAFTGELGNDGDHLVLTGNLGEPVHHFEFHDGWYPATDGHGFSLVLADPAAALGQWGDAAVWRASTAVGGSPGAADAAAPVIPQVVINEVMSAGNDWIELANLSAAPADIGGWFISDDFATPRKFRVPLGTQIPAHGFVVFTESDFNNGVDPGSFAFSTWGDEAFLFSADAAGNLTGYVQGGDFGGTEGDGGLSFGWYVDSTGHEQYVEEASSQGEANNLPGVGPLVISEIMFRPPDVLANGAWWNNTDDEFIELHNISDSPVPLIRPAPEPLSQSYPWRLDGTVTFEFPAAAVVPVDGRLVIVDFNPQSEPLRAEAFRSKYHLGEDASLVGPFVGHLDNSEGDVRLVRPGVPITFDPQVDQPTPILVDRVHYHDSAPWPAAADGAGHSLQRLNDGAFGNDVANWTTAAPTPGANRATGTPPLIVTEPVDQFVSPGGSATFQVLATADSAVRYQWLHNGSVINGATGDTLAVPNVQAADTGAYSVLALTDSGATASRSAQLGLGLPPLVRLNSPANLEQFLPCLEIKVEAQASDPDGTIARVEFYRGPLKFGETTLPPSPGRPYRASFRAEAPGTYELRAVATDNLGNTASSGPVSIEVLAPPEGTALAERFDDLSGCIVCFMGQVGKSYIFQGSTDLTPPFTWTNLSTNTVPEPWLRVADGEATQHPYRFYRFQQVP